MGKLVILGVGLVVGWWAGNSSRQHAARRAGDYLYNGVPQPGVQPPYYPQQLPPAPGPHRNGGLRPRMLDQRQGVMPDRRQGAFGPTRRPDGLDFAPPGPDRDFLPPPQVPPDVGQATLHPNFQHVQPGGRSNKRRP